MHKSSIFGLSLLMMLFLSAITSSIPTKVSASEMEDLQNYIETNYNDEESYSYEDQYEQSYEDQYEQSYHDSYDDMYSKYPTKDKKFVCPDGPFKGFFVTNLTFCNVELPEGPQGEPGPAGANGTNGINGTNGRDGVNGTQGEQGIEGPRGFNGTQGPIGPPGPAGNVSVACEECFKYWISYLQQQQVQDVINEFAEIINHLNFDFDESPPARETCEDGTQINLLPGVECLPIGDSNNLTSTAQLFDICTQLDLVVQYIAGRDPSQADLITVLEEIEDIILTLPGGINPNSPEGQAVAGIINCLIETWLPVTFPTTPTPPEELANLNVTKIIQCNSINGDPSDATICAIITNSISPENYQMSVSGNDPELLEFSGSSTGTNVELGEGDYTVDETLADTSLLAQSLGAEIDTTTTIGDGSDCEGVFVNGIFQEATGTIGAGESQTCIIINTLSIDGGTVEL
jgi:hypothetical protein